MKPQHRFLPLALFALLNTAAHAQYSADISCVGGVPIVTVTITPPVELVGLPGAFAIGVSDTSDTTAAYYTRSGWVLPNGPIDWYAAYKNGIPASITVSACVTDTTFESCSANTLAFAGYKVGATYGVLEQTGRSLISSRRASLDRNKADMMAKGRWMPIHENDEAFAEAIVAGYASKRITQVLTIPSLDCTPPDYGGGR